MLAATRPAPSGRESRNRNLAPELIALIDRALHWDRRNRFPPTPRRCALKSPMCWSRFAKTGIDREARSHEQPPAARGRQPTKPTRRRTAQTIPERWRPISELFRNLERALAAVRQIRDRITRCRGKRV